MKLANVVFREDVKIPGVGTDMKAGMQHDKPEGLALTADFEKRIVWIELAGKRRWIPFEQVRFADPAPEPEKKLEPKKREQAKLANPLPSGVREDWGPDR